MAPSTRRKLPVLALVISQAVAVAALEVAPGSPCATHCLDSPADNEWNKSASTTQTKDISCRDSDYSSTSAGQKFQSCVSCLQTSGRAHEGEADTNWFAYNLRYTVSTCVFEKPNPPITTDSSNYKPPCNTDQTCGPLQNALTSDGRSPNPSDPWEYCGTGNGSFMGPSLAPCISCLRATSDQAYLANFLVALEAGCQQSPDNVSILGLSGSLFIRDAVNITDPNAEDNSDSSGGLPTSAIIGIVVGCVLVFGLAVCLFVVYCTQQRNSSLENVYYYGDDHDPDSPKTLVDPWGYVITQPRRIPGFHDVKTAQPDNTNGEFYTRMEEAARSGRIQLTHDPRCAIQGPDNAMPAHQAYKPEAVSRKDSKSAPAVRSISPPRSVHKRRPSTPDSFIAQAYKTAVEDANRLSTNPQPMAPRISTLVQPPQPAAATTSTGRQPGWTRRLSSMVLPKIRMSKKYTPPSLALHPASPVENNGERQLRISPPLMNDARFIDRPLGAGVVVYDHNRPPTPENSRKYDEYKEVPLRSGKSALYGM